MKPEAAATTWEMLAEPSGEPASSFDATTLADLPEPARRWLTRVLPAGTLLTSGVTVEMTGEIKLGRWMRFRADQVLRAGVGFVWQPVVGGRILRFSGADVLGPDDARMEFRFHGLVPVVRASGSDVARSAAGRLAAETAVWVPQALTPQAGARWSGLDDQRAIVTLDAAGEVVDVEVAVDGDGRLRSLGLQRWNGSADPPGFEPFGGTVTDEFVTSGGVRIAGAGSVGWNWGTPQWDDGEFFHYRITKATFS
jgi:hypothetical protein